MSSDPTRSFEDAATMVHGLVPQQRGTEVVATSEVVRGRIILCAYAVQAVTQDEAGNLDPFQNQQFEVAEVAETLVLETQPRVYEEVVICKEGVDRIETVTAVLRHQEAEVTVEDQAAATVAPPQCPPKI